MKRLLDDLWYSLQQQNAVERNEEKRELVDLIVLHEEKLHTSLNAEQMERLEKYKEGIGDLHNIAEREAFIKGVRFATAFLVEALKKE